MGDNLQLLARILTAPFRLAKSLFQTAVMTATILTLLLVAPFLSFFTMPSYQHRANQVLTSDMSREYMLYDFSNNSAVAVPWDNNFSGQPYPTQVPADADY